MPRPSAIQRYSTQIAHWIDLPAHRAQLRFQLARRNQLTAAIAGLRQTESAIEAFARFEGEVGSGGHFLALYGVLQAMVLQQDALCHLQEALGAAISDPLHERALRDVRNIRNWSVGHPTKADRHDVVSHHRIGRARLARGFELISAFDDGRQQYTYVSIADLVRKQKLTVGRFLRRTVKALPHTSLKKPVSILSRNRALSASARPVVRGASASPLARPQEPRRAKQVMPPARPKPPKAPSVERRRVAKPVSMERRRRSAAGVKSLPATPVRARQKPSSQRFIRRAA